MSGGTALLGVYGLAIALTIAPEQTFPFRLGRNERTVLYRDAVVGDWISAVVRHTPGKDDEALSVVRPWSGDDLDAAWVGVNVLIALCANQMTKHLVITQSGRTVRVVIPEADRHREARIRHGRTLTRLGSYAEAADQLRAGLQGAEEPILRYYAALFLGAAGEALGRFAEAKTAYEQAMAGSSQASAPRLALSQLAYRSGDRLAARQGLEEVLAHTSDVEDDPWWTYRMSSGRSANDLIDAVRSRVIAK